MCDFDIEDEPVQLSAQDQEIWQTLGLAIAHDILRYANGPGYMRKLLEGRCRWRFNRGANRAKPRTHKRKMRLAAMKKRIQFRRDEKRRLEFDAIRALVARQ